MLLVRCVLLFIQSVIRSVSRSKAIVSTVSDLRLLLMMVPPVVMSVVVLVLLLCVLIAYPVALVPLYLHPPSDCAKMCVWVGGCVCCDLFVYVGIVVHNCVAYFVRCLVVLSVSPVYVWGGRRCCVPSNVSPFVCPVYDTLDCGF